MTAFGRWLPAITQAPIVRKAALGVAGLAFAGGALAGPAVAATEPAPQAKLVASVQTEQKAPSAKETSFQYERQPNFYYCGPASTKIALSASGHNLTQDALAEMLGTTTAGTDSAVDITRVLNKVKGGDSYRTIEIAGQKATAKQADQLRADVVDAINSGDPVVANIAGTAIDTDGNAHSLPGGHYLTVVGYKDDGRTVKIADPFETRGDGTYWMSTNDLANWIASRGYSA